MTSQIENDWRDLDHAGILAWLREEDPKRLELLWRESNAVRIAHVGDAVHLRGLIEISSHCVRQCAYCGLRAGNRDLERYRMTSDEILAAAQHAVRCGYGTVVMQAGEDYGIHTDWLSAVIRQIKATTPLAVTLSLGERPDEDLAAWRAARADRYLLRFETSDHALFCRIHPGRNGETPDRILILRRLKEFGYEVGSGIMVGIPGQTYASVANDILLFRELDLDMIGIGPFIAHPATPLGRTLPTHSEPNDDGSQEAQASAYSDSGYRGLPVGRVSVLSGAAAGWKPAIQQVGNLRYDSRDTCAAGDQVPNTELLVCKVVALTRLLCPEANIPSTTALATINRHNGRELGLQRGANVVMPNVTPLRYRRLYQIYPGKACIDETPDACDQCLRVRIARIGRQIGQGPGGRNHRPKAEASSAALSGSSL